MSQHSPGPWTHDRDRGAITYRVAPEWPDDDGTRNVVDLVGSMGGECPSADARLMAAAPELLAALKELRKNIAFDPEGDLDDRVAALVAKAEGQEP